MNGKSDSRHLWYTRCDGVIEGPFPQGQISRHILLGRIHETDKLSQDQETWRSYQELSDLVPEVIRTAKTANGRERLRLARLREDERQRDRRRKSSKVRATSEQRRSDRRRPEPREVLEHRALRAELLAAERPSYGPHRLPLAIGAVIVLLFGLTYLYQRLGATPASSAQDCAATAAPRVNWSNCQLERAELASANLSGATLNSAALMQANLERATLDESDLRYANLQGADLRYANLRRAMLAGAMLQGANLSAADLTRADLRYVNLLGAQLDDATLTDADLSRATWTNGRVCADGSVGACK